MGLDKATLKAGIKAAFLNRFKSPDADQANEMDGLAGDLADAFDNYVKGAGVYYTAGLVAPSGAVTGPTGTPPAPIGGLE